MILDTTLDFFKEYLANIMKTITFENRLLVYELKLVQFYCSDLKYQ